MKDAYFQGLFWKVLNKKWLDTSLMIMKSLHNQQIIQFYQNDWYLFINRWKKNMI